MAVKDTLRTARKAHGWSQTELAERAGVSQQLISQIEKGDAGAGKESLPLIATALGMPVEDIDPDYWTEHPRVRGIQEAAKAATPAARGIGELPLHASARGGDGEMVIGDSLIGSERHPLDGVPDAYAIYVVGDSMEPLFEQGDRILVNPHAPPAAGADVVLQTGQATETGERHAMVKRLLRSGSTEWQLEQFNPAKRFKVKRAQWPTCHVIVGKYSRR